MSSTVAVLKSNGMEKKQNCFLLHMEGRLVILLYVKVPTSQ